MPSPRNISMSILAGILWSIAGAAIGQDFETPARPGSEPRALGYLSAGAVDPRLVLAPPPAAGSVLESIDWEATERLNGQAPAARFAEAELDDMMVYHRFEQAYGAPIERTSSPALIRLLNRALEDVNTAAFEVKPIFQRLRPFQIRQLKRLCNYRAVPPAPDTNAKDRSSYPSGHSAYGWMTSYILAEVAPERAAQLLTKGAEYGESRVICGVHFYSDTEAARALAAFVVGRLRGNVAFEKDLAAARMERSVTKKRLDRAK